MLRQADKAEIYLCFDISVVGLLLDHPLIFGEWPVVPS